MQNRSRVPEGRPEAAGNGPSIPPFRVIALTGFMGAGKTTLGRLLAAELGWDFRDLDAEIEQDAGMTVAAIFRAEGEAGFRAREVAMLARMLQGERRVLALGGGAVESAEVREELANAGGLCVVYLAAPLEALVQRCLEQPGAAERPVLADRERLQTRWAARLPYYEQAHLKVETAGARPEESLHTLLALLQKQAKSDPAPVSAP
jgi:shikimate kinase